METWTIQVPQQKLAVILSQLDSSAMDSKLLVKSWEFIAGRLLWLTSAWQHLRLFRFLCRALRNIPLTMVGVDHVTFAELVDGVSPMSDRLHSLIAGIHLRRVANTNVVTKADQYGLAFQIHHLPTDCWMKMLSMVLLRGRLSCPLPHFGSPWYNRRRCRFRLQQNAMANTDFAGFGGAAIFPDGSCAWFQLRFHCQKPKRTGAESAQTCKDTLQYGNYSRSSSSLAAWLRILPCNRGRVKMSPRH